MMGPSQPEFTSYETPGSTDMVNLSTGDFSFQVPVLDIPGPERSFSLPLSYKAGIQLEQEASWVGLGWSLNAGAITRSVVGYPDDARDEFTQNTFVKQVERGWTGGVPGVLDLGWNSNTGHHGSVDLLGLASVGWDNSGINGGDLVGIGVQRGEGISVNPVRMAVAAFTIATLGAGSTLSVGADIGIQLASSVAVGVGLGAAGVGRMGGMSGSFSQPTTKKEHHWLYDNYWTFFNNNQKDYAYGSLYFGAMSQSIEGINQAYNNGPVISRIGGIETFKAHVFNNSRNCDDTGNRTLETVADVYQYAKARQGANPGLGDGYPETFKNPISVAHDYFNVMGESVSGSIRPYRLDVGSIANPKIRSLDCGGHLKYSVIPFLNDYKVGFRYENSIANAYDYHHYTPAVADHETGFSYTANNSNGILRTVDPSLETSTPSTRTQPARKGIHNPATNGAGNRHLVQGKNITWYSNAEIQQMYQSSTNGNGSGFLEFTHPTQTNNSNNYFRSRLPAAGIGAFSVTGEDGSTYHYSLPVYQYVTYSESKEVAPTVGDEGKSTQSSGRLNDGTPSGHAITWLLTAVTSSDYIDRNNSGTVDEADWGGWVKFEYGQFSEQYKWRQPYIGYSYTDDATTINTRNFTEGYKETYYLNSISTRSHTALFVKSIRKDGRGHFAPGVQASTSRLSIDEQYPSSSLRLDEIVLLDNATLAKLRVPDGIRSENESGAVIPALTNALGINSPQYVQDGPLNGREHMEKVLDHHDLDADSRIRSYIDAHVIKRVKFDYSYELCKGTPNSFDYLLNTANPLPPMDEANISTRRGGKLTLKRISILGPTVNGAVTKIIPDFTFSYPSEQDGNAHINPDYNKNRWDGFGMYKSGGEYTVNSHKPSNNTSDNDNAAWSLTKIVNPLGGITKIKYESDIYARVSERGTTKVTLTNTDNSSTLVMQGANRGVFLGNLSDVLKPGDYVWLTGKADYECHRRRYPDSDREWQLVSIPYNNTKVRVASVVGNTLTLEYGPGCTCYTGEAMRMIGMSVTTTLRQNTYGGGIRVAAIQTEDESNRVYKILYKYTDDALPIGGTNNSTGVIAKEPSFVNRYAHEFYSVNDYPETPVIYSKVSVLRGSFKTGDNDFDQREVYSFATPNSSMVEETPANIGFDRANFGVYNNRATISLSRKINQTMVDIGKIGQPITIAKYNRLGELELKTNFDYASTLPNADGIANQGHYTEGVMTHESDHIQYYLINRSTKKYIPTVLTSSRSWRNGESITNENTLYDFFTGQVVETLLRNARGEAYRTRTVPAYTLATNSGMGPKGDNATNSNMLMQQAATYVIKEKSGGPAYNPLNPFDPATSEIVSAGIQTWNATWGNYRSPDINGVYKEETGTNKPVWREQSSYVWQSPHTNANGTLAGFVDFNWSGTPDARWVKAAEVVRYDHYSHGIESRDINGLHATQKLGYGGTQVIAAAANSRYTELAYSGAEDQLQVGTATHFGGEVVAGGVRDQTRAHTGTFSNRLAPGQEGFLYRATAGTDLTIDKPYRLSVWVHNSDTDNAGRLYAAVNGVTFGEASIASSTTKKAGNWYRLSLNVTIPASANGQAVTFGCRNTRGTGAAVYFDDFRLCPFKAAMSSRVYDARTSQLTYVLDNENLYMRYQYNAAGKLVRVFKETFDRSGSSAGAERLVKEYDYNYARNAAFTVQATSVGTGQLTSSLAGGLVNFVENGGEVRYTAVSTDCRSKFNLDEPGSIKVDGIVITSNRTLPNGTRVGRLQDGCVLSNVSGSHIVELRFTTYTNYPAVNTLINPSCEYCESTQQYTGRVRYQVADGCNGTLNGGAYVQGPDNPELCNNNQGNRSAKRRSSTSTPTPALIPYCPDAPRQDSRATSNSKKASQEQKASVQR